jgi:ABC-type molybdate transport system substrate-binding protein
MKRRLLMMATCAAAASGCTNVPSAGPHVGIAGPAPAAAATPALAVYAAGSLRAALGDVAQAFERQHGQPVALTFGASGLLRDRIAQGEGAQVFASANMEHPQALAAGGRAEPVQAFARNSLCGLAVPGFSLKGQTLVQRMLDSAVRLAISTPRADPAGDYAFQMFERVEATGAAAAGSAARLKARALQLTGGPQSAPPPAGRNVYGALLAADQADLFITYCTNARQAQQEQPALQVLPVPDPINVSALYGVAVVKPASDRAHAFVSFLLGAQGQAVLARHGFSAP